MLKQKDIIARELQQSMDDIMNLMKGQGNMAFACEHHLDCGQPIDFFSISLVGSENA